MVSRTLTTYAEAWTPCVEVIINKTKYPTKQCHFQSLQNIIYLRKLDHDTVCCSESVCRLSTIQGADKIAVLQDGAILEEGRHEELLAKGEGGAYYSLINLQTHSKKSKWLLAILFLLESWRSDESSSFFPILNSTLVVIIQNKKLNSSTGVRSRLVTTIRPKKQNKNVFCWELSTRIS